MSIVTLKKKTQTQYNNMSVGMKGFSLNGTRRSQGYVGQTSLSRSLPKTIMKGNVACGHGGHLGKFRKMPIVQSAVISLNNANVVKPSVLGTSGMIDTKYRWIDRPQPYTTVKPDNNQHSNSQSDYITNLTKKTISNAAVCDGSVNYVNQICYRNVDSCLTNAKTVVAISKPDSVFKPISQSEYLIKKHNKCTVNDIKFVPSIIKYAPLPGPSKTF